jgi:hypothetical protein
MPDARNPIARKYRVAAPQSYAAVPLPGKEIRGPEGIPVELEQFVKPFPTQKAPLKIPTEEAPLRKRAVWIVHGMGQQVPFETVDGLTEGIIRVAQPPPGPDGFAPEVRVVQIGDQTIQRVELKVFEQGKVQELHLYEAYWAPVTEGEVKLSEVISFLFSASFRGLLNAIKPFHRAMFNQFVEKKIPWRAALEIAVSLLTLAALVVINAVIVAAGASAYGLAGSGLSSLNFWHLADNWASISAIASCLSAVAIAFGLILFLAELSHPAAAAKRMVSAVARVAKRPTLLAAAEKSAKFVISAAGWLAFILTLVAIIAGAATLAFLVIVGSAKLAPNSLFPELQAFATGLVGIMAAVALVALVIKGFLRSAGEVVWSWLPYEPFFLVSMGLFLTACFGPLVIGYGWIPFSSAYAVLPAWVSRPFWVWPLLLVTSGMVRTLMVQYVGDVAAYVASQTLDRFNNIRQRIKQIALDSARAVYLAQENGEFLYDKIAVVGHSLGSVIAYDTLNALMNAEKLSVTDLKIAKRTCLLETFGSPLDKIAFFFSFQGKDTFHVREQMASAVQPLITDYEEFRTFPWINVYSRNDIVSGKVELYDLPLKEQTQAVQALILQHRVQPFPDPDAIVPLAAHVAYWKNRLVWEKLLTAITAEK